MYFQQRKKNRKKIHGKVNVQKIFRHKINDRKSEADVHGKKI
jgi:hypothetical protein